MASHPYMDLPERAFWAPAVGKRHMLDISELWTAPFPIRRTDRIATYGSCFAQHFSRALIARGFSWYDAEPAPDGLPGDVAKSLNYGVFSARTANIYTCTLLLQWTSWALGARDVPEVHWEKDGRIFDPFRPTIEPGGFGSVDEMLTSRAGTIAAFRRSILEANVLVFTLGLTESWWDKAGGFEYPMCPGTAAGSFDPEAHVFKNQDFPEVRKALIDALTMIRAARSGRGPRILLTVSPVPLTATLSDSHVLVATTESKSILRAVAGQVARELQKVSYFPSFEIINSAPYRGGFFEPNMRSVNRHGVDHVMAQFFEGLEREKAARGAGEDDASTAEPAERNAAPVRDTAQTAPGGDDELICEEELLNVFGKYA